MTTLTYWLLTATWKGSLLIAASLLVARIGRGRIASRWLHALLLVAVLRLLIPVAPESRFSVFNLATRAAAVPQMTFAKEPAPMPAPMRLRRAEPLPAPAPSPWRGVLVAVWATGCAFLVVRAGVRLRALNRRLRDRVDVTSPAVLDLVDECREILGVRRGVRVVETAAVATPSLHGLVRPMLLLPHGFLDTFSLAQLRFVLLHELAHLRRSDILVNWLTIAAQALHWFNPLVHLAAARLAEERELACDALALERLAAEERSAYGGTVLEVLDRMRLPSPVPGLVGMTTTQRQMKRRILMIARFRPQTRYSVIAAALLAVIAMATLTDANAGQRRMMMPKMMPASPEAQAVIDGLEKRMDLQLTNAGLLEVTNAVTAQTGVNITFAPGALDNVQPDGITLKATNAPAHAVLIETLSALDLAVRFDDGTARVEKSEGGMRLRLRSPMPPPVAEGEALPDKVIFIDDPEGEAVQHFKIELPAPPPGSADTMTFERTPSGDKTVFHRSAVHIDSDEAGDGVARRSVQFRGGPEGQAAGTLELEVRRPTTSEKQ